jgi:DNA-binding IclR family transcriptional regulator
MTTKTTTKDPRAAAGRREGPYFSKIIDKGLRIINLFTPETTSLSLTDIARQTRINPTSTFRFVETLVQLGYLRKDARTKLIKLGPMALALGYNIIKSFDLLQIVKPAVDKAFDRHNVSIDTAVTEHGQLVLLYRREVKDTLTFTLPFVSSDLQCSALGKAYLASLPDKELRAFLERMTYVRRTPRSLTSRAAILADLRRTRTRGYSINNEEYILGLISIGAALVGVDGNVLGAVSFDTTTVQFTVDEAERRFAPAVVELAKEIQSLLPL